MQVYDFSIPQDFSDSGLKKTKILVQSQVSICFVRLTDKIPVVSRFCWVKSITFELFLFPISLSYNNQICFYDQKQ